jgi:hypothetical protein
MHVRDSRKTESKPGRSELLRCLMSVLRDLEMWPGRLIGEEAVIEVKFVEIRARSFVNSLTWEE